MRWPLHLFLAAPVAAAEPVFEATFDRPLPSLAAHGEVKLDAEGPRSPRYPTFSAENHAATFKKAGDYLSQMDPGSQSPLDFTNGNSITLEAWVRLDVLGRDQNAYLISKGRTHRPGQPQDNQNYALRLRESKGQACVNFLFSAGGTYHRWTAARGFIPGRRWHHVAITYTFGKPDSLHAWTDGQEVTGTWDMGGPTQDPPTSDDDELWLGAAMGAKSDNALHGSLDDVRIYREALPTKILAERFRFSAPEPPPLRFVSGKIAVDFFERAGSHTQWPDELPPAAASWETDSMVFHRLPRKYDDWGIRDAWQGACLLRAATEMELPVGPRRVLLRCRSLGRLSIDGKEVARTNVRKGTTDGHDPVPDLPAEVAPGVRLTGYLDQESIGEINLSPGPHRIVLETLIGSEKARVEPGECLVAVEDPSRKMFTVLSFAAPADLTDSGWSQITNRLDAAYQELDNQRRRQRAASQDGYWKSRSQFAAKWAESHPAPPIPQVSGPWPVEQPIDAFLAEKFHQVSKEAATPTPPEDEFAPIHALLADRCIRCHGEKEKGGLRLNSREAALKAGDSGHPAIVPNQTASSELVRRLKLPAEDDDHMPPKGDPFSPEQIALLERWISAGAAWPEPSQVRQVVELPTLTDDYAFLRRVYLDTVGQFPSAVEVRRFVADSAPDKRSKVISRLLEDPRWADHWVSYWQDVLAENPNILKPSLNNSGAFRWFLHEALLDNLPMDQLVTNLVMLRGSTYQGGSAGFGLAADNDAPLAQKAHILSSAFLGVEMKCARCHDSPFHSTTQRQLFSLAAMLERSPVTVPKTSSVPAGFFDKHKGRKSMIKVTLPPGQLVAPEWPFGKLAPADAAAALCRDPQDSRERLAACLTSPTNERFAQVIVNRVWKRLLGTGLVEPADDWEGSDASHPALLRWLAHRFVAHGFDLKYLAGLILNSAAYQREAKVEPNFPKDPARRLFAAPDRRRLTAEQVVDSLFSAAGRQMNTEEISFDPEAMRDDKTMINLGRPRRAWQFASISNERDRPSLSLPKAQAILSVLETFGWRPSRAEPLTCREDSANVLQPATLENGVVSTWLATLSEGASLTQVALDSSSPAALVEELMLRFLGRMPRPEESAEYEMLAAMEFEDRRVPDDEIRPVPPLPPLRRVSWTNHLKPEASEIQLEAQARVRAGDAPTPRLRTDWRERIEDLIWALVNSPEILMVP